MFETNKLSFSSQFSEGFKITASDEPVKTSSKNLHCQVPVKERKGLHCQVPVIGTNGVWRFHVSSPKIKEVRFLASMPKGKIDSTDDFI